MADSYLCCNTNNLARIKYVSHNVGSIRSASPMVRAAARRSPVVIWVCASRSRLIAFEFAKRWRASSIGMPASAVIAPPINALKSSTAFVGLIRRTILILKTPTIALQYEFDREDAETLNAGRLGAGRSRQITACSYERRLLNKPFLSSCFLILAVNGHSSRATVASASLHPVA